MRDGSNDAESSSSSPRLEDSQTRFEESAWLMPSRRHIPENFGAPLYPLFGVLYLFRHPVLFRTFRQSFIPSLIISSVVLLLLFYFTYLPHVAWLGLFVIHGPLAFISAALAVLSESATIIWTLLQAFVLENPLNDLFDAVLIVEGFEDLVAVGREIHRDGRDSVAKLGEITKDPGPPFSLRSTIVWLLELPLNLIPIAGVPIFTIVQGYSTGWLSHYHYYQLLQLKKKARQQAIKERHWAYLGFGTVSLILQLVPLAATMFQYTTVIGAALWAVHIERNKRGQGTAPSHPGRIEGRDSEEQDNSHAI